MVVMPNHVHVLVGTGGTALGRIVQGWKGASARAINGSEGTSGSLWQREYYDRFVRDEEQAIAAVRYIAENPGKAGIGGRDWPGLWVREGLQDTAD
jgi:REP element-mobilizing transposase RayT